MKIKTTSIYICMYVVMLTLACTLGDAVSPTILTQSVLTEPTVLSPAIPELSSGDLIMPEDLEYLGAFRLPDASGGSNWEYSGHGLTFYPNGNPSGAVDGFPGSLFGFGHDHHLQVSEIDIPEPVISKNLNDLKTAETLQPFVDITDGMFVPEEMVIPRAGIEYLPEPEPKLHFVFGQHLQGFEASHGWSNTNLSNLQSAGPWYFGSYSNYVTNDYLFEIPPEWAERIAPGMRLATGRAREGLWSGRGPALFAYDPWADGSPPPSRTTLSTITPLLLYGVQDANIPDLRSDESMAVIGYKDADHWWGGAWLTDMNGRASVIFAGTKALGNNWYGFANGVIWEHDCAETNSCPEVPDWPYDNRGFWAEGYQAQIIFYNPTDLVAVAHDQMETWSPQPYATLVLDRYLLSPKLDHTNYKRDLVGALAFDRSNGLIYLVERLADEYKSIVHVFRINSP